MTEWQYWRITPKRGKPHLAPFFPGQESGTRALCGKVLPEDQRRRPSASVKIPDGSECQKCRMIAGYFEKPKLTDEEKQNIKQLKVITHLAKLIDALPMSAEDKKTAFMRIAAPLGSS